jgi:hypothetical protein
LVITTSPSGFCRSDPTLPRKHVRRDADRASEAFADLLAQGLLHLQGQFPRDRHLPFGAHHLAGHLVDRAHLLDRQTRVDGFQNSLLILGVEPVIGLHRNGSRAQLPRIAHQGAGLDAERLGRVAGCDRHGRIRQGLLDNNRVPAQGRVFLLLARRKAYGRRQFRSRSVLDLAFREQTSDFDGWSVVDFKTDQEFSTAASHYIAQVDLSARAVQAETDLPARGIILVL